MPPPIMYSFGVATCLLSIVVSIRPEVLLLLFRLSSSSVSPPEKYHNKSHIGHSSAICHLKPRLSAFVSIHPPPPPIDATYEYISTSGHIHMIYHQAICFIPRSLLLITTCTNVLSMFPLHVATLNCNLIERC